MCQSYEISSAESPSYDTEKPQCSLDVVQPSVANVLEITCLCQGSKANYPNTENKAVLSVYMYVITYYIRLPSVVTSVQNLLCTYPIAQFFAVT